MENKEIKTNKTETAQKDSFGLKIAMAILAVAVVVLTLINAAPFGESGEANRAVIAEAPIAVTRIVHRNTNASRDGAEQVENNIGNTAATEITAATSAAV